MKKLIKNHKKLARQQLRVDDWDKYGVLMLNDIEVEYEDLTP
ncbi:MAG: hypothetical protein ACE5FT_02135 [Candidatus Nanoarchaeia archaeon]